MSIENAGNQQKHAGILVAETEKILADPVFHRSPVLSRLLQFLVDETIAGRAETLKSFNVAVDGLGRPETFDPASDSSARVQMVRLRKALETHYAQHGPSDQNCIYLRPGSYNIQMADLAVAYPNLFGSRPAENELPVPKQDTGSAMADIGEGILAKASTPLPRRSIGGRLFFAFAFVAAALLSVTAYTAWRFFSPSQRTPMSPILEIMPIASEKDNDLDRTARMISSTLTDDLPRFKLSRVRVIMAGNDVRQPSNGEHVYRLFSRLDKNLGGAGTLFLRLNDVRTNTVFWSRQVEIPIDTLLASQAIAPLVSEINGPFGAIAAREAVIYRDWTSGGYSCALKYFTFVATREKADERKVLECIEKPVDQEEMVATMLAARALFTLEKSAAVADPKTAAKQAMEFAHAAVAADPNDGSANFAAARISYTLNDCVSAKYYTKRTQETNPRSSMFTSTLAALAAICDYPDAEKMLDQALLVQNSTYATGRLLLVLAALSQNRPDKISEIIAGDLPEEPYNRINYYLAETLIAASQGNRANAARNWNSFSQLMRPENKSPDEKLRNIVLHPIMRRRVIEFLEKGGAFEK